MEKRFSNLDYIKILSSFGICIHHYFQCFSLELNERILNYFISCLGYLVELFFMISGFLCALTFKKNENTRNQYLRKWKKLYPQSFYSILYSSILMLISYFIFGKGIWGNSYSILGIITSFLLINQGWLIEFSPAINNPIWYLCVLLWLFLIFYFIEFLCIKFKNNKFRLFYLLLIIIGFLGYNFSFSYPFLFQPDCRGYSTFFLGVVLFDIYKTVSKQRKIVLITSFLFIINILIIFLVCKSFNWYLYVIFICPSIIMISTICKQIKSLKISNIPVICYLWHVPYFYSIQIFFDLLAINFDHKLLSCLFFITIFYVFIIVVNFYRKGVNYNEKSSNIWCNR